MRLSDLLSKAPDRTEMQVERFLLSDRRISWGKHTPISIGKVTHNFHCRVCEETRTFQSGDKLACLIVGEKLVSIDTSLKCLVCSASVEAWFLVECVSDLYTSSPTVRIDRYTENLRGLADRVATTSGPFADLVKRADLAFEAGLGAGSMIYLRKIFEMITTEVAEISEIPIPTGKYGQIVNFRGLLQSVDEKRRIIPQRFSSNGYTLFQELSDVIHGDANEDEALKKFKPCRELVLGVVEEVNRDNVFAKAIEELGWAADDIDKIAGQAVVP
jgi:hypothetical protein